MQLEKVIREGKGYMGRLGISRATPTAGMVIEVPQGKWGKNEGKGRIMLEIYKNIKVLEKVSWKQLFTDF